MSRTLILALLAAGLAVPTVVAGGEIHGTIETVDGERLTGPLRWGGDEAFWEETLDASKTERVPADAGEEKGFELSFFGWKVVDSGSHGRVVRMFAVPFGHLARIERLPDGSALITLKNGESLELGSEATSDLGRRLDDIVITAKGAPVEIPWARITSVRFSDGKGAGLEARRLYGTAELADGTTLTGFIVWDADERMTDEKLDGNDISNEHHIPFAEIASIERLTRGSRVVLRDGKELELTGTNDVDSGHRGVAVTVAGVGTAEVRWDHVTKVTFEAPPASRGYADFDGGRRLSGKVKTTLGPSYTGEITWDRDESYTWETLDGDSDNVEWQVPFENIVSIRALDDIGVELKLRNDRTLQLYGSNDVDASNRGIVITTRKGQTTTETSLTWDSFAGVELD
jgi:hypothetical protein